MEKEIEEFRKRYDGKLKEFGFKYSFSDDQGKDFAIEYEAEDYENPEKWIVLLFRLNKETGEIYVFAFHYIKEREIFSSNYIPLNELFDVLKASYEKGKGFSVKKFIDNLVD